jgi:hypothetical protein
VQLAAVLATPSCQVESTTPSFQTEYYFSCSHLPSI